MIQRDDIVRWAMAQVGKPYATYRDCSGFAAAAYRQIGITIPEGSVAQYGVGEEVRGVIEPGDLIFYDTFGPAPGHVAIYVGNGAIVHALNEQRGIVTSEWDTPMGGNDRYMGARRILVPSGSPVEDDPAPVEESPKVKRPRRKHRRRKDRA